MNHKVVCVNNREILVRMKEGSLEFDLILLQLRGKTALSLRWPLTFKSLQIKLSFLSLCCHSGKKALKMFQPSENLFLGG